MLLKKHAAFFITAGKKAAAVKAAVMTSAVLAGHRASPWKLKNHRINSKINSKMLQS
ncbi:MAG: hypothetical protein ACTFAK_15140 [Candidatus Electronema sp. VV]